MKTKLSPRLEEFIKKNLPKDLIINERKAKQILNILEPKKSLFKSYFIWGNSFLKTWLEDEGDRRTRASTGFDLPIQISWKTHIQEIGIGLNPVVSEILEAESAFESYDLSDYRRHHEQEKIWEKISLSQLITDAAAKLWPTLYQTRSISELPDKIIMVEVAKKGLACFRGEIKEFLLPRLVGITQQSSIEWWPKRSKQDGDNTFGSTRKIRQR